MSASRRRRPTYNSHAVIATIKSPRSERSQREAEEETAIHSSIYSESWGRTSSSTFFGHRRRHRQSIHSWHQTGREKEEEEEAKKV